MRKSSKVLLVTVVGMATALAVGVAPAFGAASDVLTYGSKGGTNVTTNSTLTASLPSGNSATFYDSTSGTEGVKCTGSTMTQTVSTNPAAPGTADLSTTGLSYSGCTSNLYGFGTVEAAQVAFLPYSTTAADSGSNPIQIQGVVFRLLLSGSQGTEQCNYEVASGALSGTTTFTNQDFQMYIQSDQSCPGDMYASAQYGTIHDTSVSGSPVVYVN